jgi:hypothetical protein
MNMEKIMAKFSNFNSLQSSSNKTNDDDEEEDEEEEGITEIKKATEDVDTEEVLQTQDPVLHLLVNNV